VEVRVQPCHFVYRAVAIELASPCYQVFDLQQYADCTNTGRLLHLFSDPKRYKIIQ
jgi:hypothetical protein